MIGINLKSKIMIHSVMTQSCSLSFYAAIIDHTDAFDEVTPPHLQVEKNTMIHLAVPAISLQNRRRDSNE